MKFRRTGILADRSALAALVASGAIVVVAIRSFFVADVVRWNKTAGDVRSVSISYGRIGVNRDIPDWEKLQRMGGVPRWAESQPAGFAY